MDVSSIANEFAFPAGSSVEPHDRTAVHLIPLVVKLSISFDGVHGIELFLSLVPVLIIATVVPAVRLGEVALVVVRVAVRVCVDSSTVFVGHGFPVVVDLNDLLDTLVGQDVLGLFLAPGEP